MPRPIVGASDSSKLATHMARNGLLFEAMSTSA